MSGSHRKDTPMPNDKKVICYRGEEKRLITASINWIQVKRNV